MISTCERGVLPSLDLRRANKFDIPFGRGAHYCLGHAVARAEMCEALKVLTQRLTRVRFDGAVVMPPDSMAFMRGPESIPLAFEWR